MSTRTRVLIADDEAVLRDAMSDVIRSDATCELVGAAIDADEAIALATGLDPDVVIVDVKMPGGGGARATAEIRRLAPRTRILGFSVYNDQETVFELLRSGASGYLVKGASPDELLAGIHKVHAGQSPLSPQVASGVITRLADDLEQEHSDTSAQMERLARVRGAISGGFRMAYQPIVRLHDRAVVGHEALARFHIEPTMPPNLWFAEAAAAGLLIDMELATARAAILTAPQTAGTFLSINASPETLLSGRFDIDCGTAPPYVLEITEHAPVEDYERLARALAPLRSRGVRLAIDDAGAGFASLRHILLLDPQLIKLDLSLIRGIDANSRRRALAAALVTFAHEIAAEVVAEGIETDAERRAVIDLGIEYGQGFLLGRPEVGE